MIQDTVASEKLISSKLISHLFFLIYIYIYIYIYICYEIGSLRYLFFQNYVMKSILFPFKYFNCFIFSFLIIYIYF